MHRHLVLDVDLTAYCDLVFLGSMHQIHTDADAQQRTSCDRLERPASSNCIRVIAGENISGYSVQGTGLRRCHFRTLSCASRGTLHKCCTTEGRAEKDETGLVRQCIRLTRQCVWWQEKICPRSADLCESAVLHTWPAHMGRSPCALLSSCWPVGHILSSVRLSTSMAGRSRRDFLTTSI